MASLRPAVHIVLVLAFALSTQGSLVVRGLFAARQGYIAENLCENRYRPELNCNGHCLLAERLAEQRQKEGRPAVPEVASVVTSILTERVSVDPPPVDRRRDTATPTDERIPGSESVADVFRPPRLG